MTKVKEWAGLVALVAIILASFLGSSVSLGGTTNYDQLDTTDGYSVDGTSIIDGSGVWIGTITAAAKATLDAGTLKSYAIATSTFTSAYTLVLGDINAYDTVILTPNISSVTLTLPASSTVSTWLPTAGDSQTTCILNGTTTAGIDITVAGGTGTTLLVASSSATALGSKVIAPQKIGCFTFTRGNATATTFDILSAFTAYQ